MADDDVNQQPEPWENAPRVSDTLKQPPPADNAASGEPESWTTAPTAPRPPGWGTPGIVQNPGATPDYDVSAEMKRNAYEMARGMTGNLVEKVAPEPLKQQSAQYESEHPYQAKTAQFVGSMIPGVIAPAVAPAALGLGAGATLPRAVMGNALLGGAFGAASGYGESTDHPVRDALTGGAAGAAVGAALPLAGHYLVKPAFEGIATSLAPGMAEKMAFNRVRDRIAQGGPSIEDMRLALSMNPDKPLGLVDVASDAVRGLAGSVARTPGTPSQQARQFFSQRDVGAMGRVLDDIDNHVSAGQDVFTSMRAIDAKKALEAKPLYDLFENYRPISPDQMQPGAELRTLLDTPAMRRAAKNAVEDAANRRIDPNTLGITFNEAGDPIYTQVPSWQTLQHLKKGLDTVINRENRDQMGRIVWDDKTRAVEDLRSAYDNFLGTQNPFWKPANAKWAGETATQNAMQWGQDFKQFTPAQIEYKLSQMNPAEKEGALVGLADTLRKDVMKTRPTADEAAKVLPQGEQEQGWQWQQLKPFFQDQGTFKRWVGRVLAESKMAQTKGQVTGGSQTAERVQEDAGGHGAMPDLLKLGAGLAALHAEPFAGVPLAYSGARGMLERMGQPGKRVGEKMGPILFNPNYGENMQNLQRLEKPRNAPLLPTFIPGLGENAGAIPGGILGTKSRQ